jgi:rhodanese-related sulfurtransferase
LGKDKVHIDPLRPGVPHPHRLEEEPEEISVEEVAVEELREALTHAGAPLVLDVREPYEWRQVRMPGALHIPMNSVPDQLERLPKERPVVVICAHGNRSYGVAAWLMEQGYHAASLRGGITQWARHGGHIEQGAPAVE